MIRRFCDRIAEGESRVSLMNFEWSRFESFKTFPVGVPVSTLWMTKTGFYYVGQSDEVKCFSCSVVYNGWREGDSPSQIHARLSPSCEFVRGTDGNNVPIHHHSTTTTQDSSENDNSAGETNGASADRTQTIENPVANETAVHNKPEQPKYPMYAEFTARFSSFTDPWVKEDVISSEALAESGFFYTGFEDCVRCFQCGIGLRNWETGDDPWVEHAKHFPWCNNLLKQKGSDFVSVNGPEICTPSGAAEALSNKNTSEDISHEEDNLERFIYQRNDQTSGQPDGSGNVKDHEYVKDEERRGLDAKAQALEKELEELKDKLMCKLCYNYEANIVFLPCSHLVSCQTCAPQITKCAICRQPIEGRKKIFLP